MVSVVDQKSMETSPTQIVEGKDEEEKNTIIDLSKSDDADVNQECKEYLNRLTYPDASKVIKIRIFHPAPDDVYKGVLLCFEYCHKHLVSWEAAPDMLKISVKDAFILAKETLYGLIDLYSKCNSGLMQFANFMLQMMLEEKWTKSHFYMMVTLIPHYRDDVASDKCPKFGEEFNKMINSKEPVVSLMTGIFIV